MSTRTNILIENKKTKLWLYRHYDGYLSATGHDLMINLIHNKDVTSFVTSLLATNYDACELHSKKAVYEVTSEQHCDIDFLYRFIFDDRKGKVKIIIDQVSAYDSELNKNLITTDFFSVSRDEVKKNCNLIFEARKNSHSYA